MKIEEHYWRTFSTNWEIAQQQINSLVAKYGIVTSFTGKEYVYSQIDKVTWNQRTERLAKTVLKQISTARRKISKKFYDSHFVFDVNDQNLLGEISRPDSELMTNMKAAWARLLDQEFIRALKATVYGGEDPLVTPITFDSNQTIAANYVASGSPTNSGMTREKLQRALRKFRENDFTKGMVQSGEQLYVMMSPQHADELYNQATARSHDNASKGVIDWYENRGCTGELLGFETIIHNMVETDSSDISSVMCWAKSAMRISVDKSELRHAERPDMSYANQISGMGELGFMRRWELGVVEILCDNSP